MISKVIFISHIYQELHEVPAPLLGSPVDWKFAKCWTTQNEKNGRPQKTDCRRRSYWMERKYDRRSLKPSTEYCAV